MRASVNNVHSWTTMCTVGRSVNNVYTIVDSDGNARNVGNGNTARNVSIVGCVSNVGILMV